MCVCTYESIFTVCVARSHAVCKGKVWRQGEKVKSCRWSSLFESTPIVFFKVDVLWFRGKFICKGVSDPCMSYWEQESPEWDLKRNLSLYRPFRIPFIASVLWCIVRRFQADLKRRTRKESLSDLSSKSTIVFFLSQSFESELWAASDQKNRAWKESWDNAVVVHKRKKSSFFHAIALSCSWTEPRDLRLWLNVGTNQETRDAWCAQNTIVTHFIRLDMKKKAGT